jgi:hypothetical protein
LQVDIEQARERVHHFEAIRNEPVGGKKLKYWKRELNKLYKQAEKEGQEVPPNPHDPEEMAAAALAEAKKRVRASFQVQRGFTGWAPWGETGWSAVIVDDPGRVWSRVSRVDPRTNGPRAEEAPTGKVRREKLIYRDPEKTGADRPPGVPTDYWTPEAVEPPEDEELEERSSSIEDAAPGVPRPGLSPAEWDQFCVEEAKKGLCGDFNVEDW